MEFDAVVSGDRAIQARFAEWPKDIHDSLLQRIQKLTAELYGRVRSLAPERTGKLRNEIISRVFDDPENIKGMVTLAGGLSRAEYIKAGAQEYGVHRPVPMRAHRRTITEAFGRDISPTRILVSQHPRDVDLEQRMYLRGGLAGMEDEAVAELTEAMNERLKE
jgi:hypothetical protein